MRAHTHTNYSYEIENIFDLFCHTVIITARYTLTMFPCALLDHTCGC